MKQGMKMQLVIKCNQWEEFFDLHPVVLAAEEQNASYR